MRKSNLLAQAKTPNGSLLSLHERDGEYVIRADGRELMSTRHYASEEKLAELACAPFKGKPSPKVLIGGLGLGFTLRSALNILPQKAKVIVAELMPEVVAWNDHADYGLAKTEIHDPRTQIIVGDVGDVIKGSKGQFDAIMLDADNGTTAMNSESNKALYLARGIEQVREALKGDGIVAYWSAQDEPRFAKSLGKAGFKVDIHKVRSHASSGSIHTLLVGRRFERRRF